MKTTGDVTVGGGVALLKATPYTSRNQFGQILAERGLVGGAAVEVGTHRGEFARCLLRSWPGGGTLYCVDHWSVPPGYEAQAACLAAIGGRPGDREDDYAEALRVLAPFAGRAVLLREASADAAARFAPRTLDFVYLDGDHERPGIDRDLELWWPKVRPGGILAGHDFIMPGEVGGGWGQYVQPAVMEFAAREGALEVLLVHEENGLPWSWFVEKKKGGARPS